MVALAGDEVLNTTFAALADPDPAGHPGPARVG